MVKGKVEKGKGSGKSGESEDTSRVVGMAQGKGGQDDGYNRPGESAMKDSRGFDFSLPSMQTAREHGHGPGQGYSQSFHGHLHSQSNIRDTSGPVFHSHQQTSPNSKEQLEDHISSTPSSFNNTFLSEITSGSEGSLSLDANPPLPLSHSNGISGSISATGLNIPRSVSAGSSTTATDHVNDHAHAVGDMPASASSTTGSIAAGLPANGNKGRQVGGASDFVKKLYRMLEEDQYRSIVTWGPKGDSFIVKVRVTIVVA